MVFPELVSVADEVFILVDVPVQSVEILVPAIATDLVYINKLPEEFV